MGNRDDCLNIEKGEYFVRIPVTHGAYMMVINSTNCGYVVSFDMFFLFT